jgi:CubicO group peptidase (beta-lactamase class C family)
VIAFGNAGPGAPPLSSRTVFEIGSIAKTFTGAILADMVRRGELSLDDPVAKFLPAGVKVPSRNGRQITLLDLATHTSGLPRSPDRSLVRNPSNPYADIPIADVYAFLASHELQRDVGAGWEYSNLGYGLLGQALARAAGAETFDELVRTRITGPLKMATTRYGRADGFHALMAKGHNRQGEVVPYWDFGVFKGAGGLNSNVEDLLTYIDANIGEPRLPIEAAMRDAHEPRHSLSIDGNSQSLGWDYRERPGRTIIYKSGSTAGFAGALGFDPANRAGVVVLGNGQGFESRVDVVLQLLRGRVPVGVQY